MAATLCLYTVRTGVPIRVFVTCGMVAQERIRAEALSAVVAMR